MSPPSGKRVRWWWYLLLLFLGALPYLDTLQAPLTSDDVLVASENPMLADPGNTVYVPMPGSPALSGQGLIGAVPAGGDTPIPFDPILDAGTRTDREQNGGAETAPGPETPPEEPEPLF